MATDTSTVELLPVKEAKIFKFGSEESTGPILEISDEKCAYLLEHFKCPTSDPQMKKQYKEVILQNYHNFAQSNWIFGGSVSKGKFYN